jgi:hypothetical protein
MRCRRGSLFQVYFSVRMRHLFANNVFLNDSRRYPEMIDLHSENLASALLSSKSQDIQERFNKKLRSFSNGEIPHAANAISALFGTLALCPASEVPPKIDNPNPKGNSKCTWAQGGNREIPPQRKSMNIALIRSMHHGSFLDMEYRVRNERVGPDQFAPIYLSSTVFLAVRSKLDVRRSRPSVPALHRLTTCSGTHSRFRCRRRCGSG